jgi:hypothetical protein
MVSISTKAAILCFFIEGSGHIWVGEVKRGLLILAGAIIIGVVAYGSLPYGLSFLPSLGYKIWQMSDVRRYAAIREAEQAARMNQTH